MNGTKFTIKTEFRTCGTFRTYLLQQQGIFWNSE